MTSTLKNWCASTLLPIYAILQRIDYFLEKHHTVFFWIIAVIYRFVLDAVYIWAASPQYSYAGLVYTPVSWKYLISWGMYLVLFFALPRKERHTTTFLLHLQFVYTVAPLLSFYALANGSSKYMLMVFVCVFLQILILRKETATNTAVHISGIQNYVTVMLGILTVFSLIVPVLYNGFEGLKAFDFAYIYVMRAKATYPPGFPYLFDWMQKAIIPFGIVYFLHIKKYGWSLICMFVQTIFFMESGSKITMLLLVPILAIYFLSKTGHLLKLMYIGLTALLLMILICYLLDRRGAQSSLGVLLNATIPIRALFIPADNKFNYYECFQIFPFLYFSEGLIGKIFGLTYPFAGSVGQVVHAYTGEAFLSSNSNTGYLGDSYVQMGFVGMLLMSLLLAGILRGVQSLESEENAGVFVAMLSVFMIVLNDGALFTVLLTSGLLVTLVLFSVYLTPSLKGESHGIQRL